MAVLMLVMSVPFTASAADPLTLSEDTGINTQWYSNIAYRGDDYIASVFEGVNKDKTIVVNKGETKTLVFNAGSYTSASYGNVDFSAATTGSYHYGDSGNSNYCIATDYPFTLTGEGIGTITVSSGFGSSKTGDGNYGSSSTSAISTTFVIDTANIDAGEYDLSLYFKYQMKKKSGWSWRTAYEYAGTIDGFKLIVVDDTTTSMGGSIRVGNAGLRFGFSTTAAADDVSEYGFLYSVSEKPLPKWLQPPPVRTA